MLHLWGDLNNFHIGKTDWTNSVVVDFESHRFTGFNCDEDCAIDCL